MPDLTLMLVATCATNTGWASKVKGETGVYTVRWCYQFGKDVQFDYECTCPSFANRGTHCKHICKIINDKLRCGWNELLEPTASMPDLKKCPSCGGPVVYERVGV